MEPLQILERYYNTFIDSKSPKNFFLGLADYLDYGDAMPEYDLITTQISELGQPFFDKYREYEINALKGIYSAKKEVDTYIKKNKIEDAELQLVLQEYDNYKDGRIHSSQLLPLSLYWILGRILERLYLLPEHKDFATKYAQFLRNNPTLVERYITIKSVDDFQELKDELDRTRKLSIWGQQAQLYEMKDIIRNGRETYKNIVERARKGEGRATLEMLNFAVVLSEWTKIEEDRPEKDAVLFVIEEVHPIAQRFHTYILANFSKAQAKLKNTQDIKGIGKSKKIKEIIFIEKKTKPKSTYNFYINSDLGDVRQLRGDSNRIKKLINIIKNESMVFDKSLLDYINSNKDCALYCAGKYNLTKIIEKSGQYIKICYGIKAKVISEIEYKKKLNKEKSA